MRKGIVLIVILLAIAGIVLYIKVSRGPKDIRGADAEKVTAASLYQSYLSDSVAASALYSGAVVEVQGEVMAATSTPSEGPHIVQLQTASAGAFINCTLEQGDVAPEVGDTITVKGICSGIGEGDEELGIEGDVYLSRCVIVSP